MEGKITLLPILTFTNTNAFPGWTRTCRSVAAKHKGASYHDLVGWHRLLVGEPVIHATI